MLHQLTVSRPKQADTKLRRQRQQAFHLPPLLIPLQATPRSLLPMQISRGHPPLPPQCHPLAMPIPPPSHTIPLTTLLTIHPHQLDIPPSHPTLTAGAHPPLSKDTSIQAWAASNNSRPFLKR